jgi:hypothetical protein
LPDDAVLKEGDAERGTGLHERGQPTEQGRRGAGPGCGLRSPIGQKSRLTTACQGRSGLRL